MATTVRTTPRAVGGRAVVVRPAARVPVRRPPRRRPVRHPVYRRRRIGRGGQQVPDWAVVAGALLVLLLAGRGVAEVAAPAPPPVAEAGGLVCTTANGPGVPVAGFAGRQLAHAAAIVAAGKEMGVPERGHVIAVATAMQESKLKMYANRAVPASMSLPHEAVGSDHDSTGLFQQRQRGWGTLAQRMEARESARLFYAALLRLPGWQSMPLTVAAQRVQISAHPDRYAKWEDEAAQVVAAVSSGIACTPTGRS
jgi:hypothetical protein